MDNLAKMSILQLDTNLLLEPNINNIYLLTNLVFDSNNKQLARVQAIIKDGILFLNDIYYYAIKNKDVMQ